MTAIGVAPWDVVFVTGTRRTAVRAAKAPPGTDPRMAWCDDLTLRNARVTGGVIQVERAPLAVCHDLTLHGPAFVTENVDPQLVRAALLGKPVCAGDHLSLLSLDYSVPDPVQAAHRQALGHQLGQGWDRITLEVRGCEPAEAGIIAPNTTIRWEAARHTAVQQPGSASAQQALGVPPVPVSAREGREQAFELALPRQFGRVPDGDPFHRGATAHGPLSVGPPGPGPQVTGPALLTPPPGLAEPARQLTEWLDLDFHHRDMLARLGTSNQLGVLVSSPSGSGVGPMIAAACSAVHARAVRLWGPQVLAEADPRVALDTALAQARAAHPAVLVIDDVEALAPATETGEPGPQLAATLLLIEEAVRDPRIAVICTTHQPDRVHRDVRAEGRLDRELVLQPPDAAARLEMLTALTATMPLAGVDLSDVAARTSGFVLADLQGLTREAATRAAFRARHEGGEVTVTVQDVDAALDVVHPSTAEGLAMPIPDVTLDDVGGMEEVKQVLTEVVLWPLQHPDTFQRLGVQAPGGVLLYGPPGCGKTHVVRALAGSGRLTVFTVKGAELLSKWVGESERAVRELFRTARTAAPSLIFLDEVDALAPVRGSGGDSGTTDRVVAALLTELDGMTARDGVVVVGATNRRDRIDPAVLRSGRLERHLAVPPPDRDGRLQVLTVAARRSPLADDVDLAAIAAATEGYASADCDALVREAALAAMRESLTLNEIGARHFDLALATVRPSLAATSAS